MGEVLTYLSGLGLRNAQLTKKLCDVSRPACLLLLYRRRILTCIAYHSLLLSLVFPSLGSQHSQHQAAHRPVLQYVWLGHLGRGVPQGQDALAW